VEDLKKDTEMEDLKKKLGQKEECEGLATLKRKLEDQEEQLEAFKAKIKKQDQFVKCLKEGLECPVCLDIPRSGPVPVCPNGHLVCKECKREACPTCRAVMRTGRSLLAVTIIEKVDHKCKFNDCKELFPLGNLLENHEAACPQRTVICPKPLCNEKVPLSGLISHLLNSDFCCRENSSPLPVSTIGPAWNVHKYNVGTQGLTELGTWPTHIYTFDGEVFVVFPLITGGTCYFMLVMFASVAKCSKYNMKMVVHDHNNEVELSTNATIFLGSPLSIDSPENAFKLYGITGQLMRKIMEKSENNQSFSFSFKVSKSVWV